MTAPEAPPATSAQWYCGGCAGWREVWCPDCCGFSGCLTCHHTFKLPCPEYAGGNQELIRW